MRLHIPRVFIPITLILAGFILIFSVVTAQGEGRQNIESPIDNILNIQSPNSGPPGFPFSVYGTVLENGSPAPVGVEVSAWCLGVQRVISQTYEYSGDTWYGLDVPHDESGVNGCPVGEAVSFMIDGYLADQTRPFVNSPEQVDLTYSTSSNVYLPLVIR
jgi:hypothetical protein